MIKKYYMIFHNINYRKHNINKYLLSDIPLLRYNDMFNYNNYIYKKYVLAFNKYLNKYKIK